jgi:hypothetical protein
LLPLGSFVQDALCKVPRNASSPFTKEKPSYEMEKWFQIVLLANKHSITFNEDWILYKVL